MYFFGHKKNRRDIAEMFLLLSMKNDESLLIDVGRCRGHVTFYYQTSDFVLGVGAKGDGLAEMPRKFAGTVVSDCHLTAFSRLDGFFRILRYGASARSNSLMNYQRAVACILEFEFASYFRTAFRERAKVV